MCVASMRSDGEESMSTALRKFIFFVQIFVVAFAAHILSLTEYYTVETSAFVSLLLACIGVRHMITIGRSWGWGVFAATGLGALIILCLPPNRDFLKTSPKSDAMAVTLKDAIATAESLLEKEKIESKISDLLGSLVAACESAKKSSGRLLKYIRTVGVNR
jgi:hypothetical protein